jgi:hypothetical protein
VSRPKKCVGQRLLRHSTSSERQSGEAKCSLGLKKALFLSDRQRRRRTSRRPLLFARASRRSSSGVRSRGGVTSTSGPQGTNVVKIPLVSRAKEGHRSRAARARDRRVNVAAGRCSIARAPRRHTSCASAWSSDRCTQRPSRIVGLVGEPFFRLFRRSWCARGALIDPLEGAACVPQRERSRHRAAPLTDRSVRVTSVRSASASRTLRVGTGAKEPLSYPCLPPRRRAAPCRLGWSLRVS